MKQWFKRIGAVLLTVAMLATMVPAVFAANTLSTSVSGLSASWEYTSKYSGTATWTSTGNSISATSKGYRQPDVSALTLTNNSGIEAELSFNWTFTTGGTTTGRGALSGAIVAKNKASASGEFSQVLAAGESITISLQAPIGAATFKATFNITDLALIGLSVPDPILTFKPAEGGSYTLNGVTVTDTVANEVPVDTVFQLAATAADGYVFYGWYDAKSDQYLSQDAIFKVIASADAEISPVFLSKDVALFGVGAVKYHNLSDAAAAAAASNTDKTVVLLNDGTITGDHVIPAGVTLLIPYDDANTMHNHTYDANNVYKGVVPGCTSAEGTEVKWTQPYAYRTLTMAADATITVNGALEVGGRHSAAAAGRPSAPTDALGYIYMTAGSHIEVNGELFAWGYIYGDGTVTANNGAAIYEVFQITDLRGGNATLQLASDLMVFPMTQYYVQNVEVATRYNYGATAYITTSFFLSGNCITAPAIKFIGEDAMFQTGEDCYIIKKYDPATDTLNLDAYGDCALSTLSVSLAGHIVNSSNFILPISNNINISIWSGTATLKQDVMMLPGSTLTVGPEATLEIANTATPSVSMTEGGGHNLIIFDSENWTTGLNVSTLEKEEGLHYVYPSKQFVPAPYSPSERKIRTVADLKDVVLDINGIVVTDGFLYSTVTWADAANQDTTIVSGGAEIISSEGTGKVCMNSGAGFYPFFFMFDQDKGPEGAVANGYYMIPIASAQLKNGNGSLLDTTGAAPGTIYTYCKKHNHWIVGEACNLPDSVEITWNVEGVTTTIEVLYGETPACPFAPEKNLDNNYHYTFAGWSTTAGGAVIDLPAAESAATYYAVFTPVAHTYGTSAEGGKHFCVCGKPASCIDADKDGDHLCDLGCGDVKSEHKGGTATCDKQAVCTECKQGYGSTPDHVYDDEYDADCNNCGTVREVPEKPADVIYGDADGDGDITTGDVVTLQQFLAEWDDVEIDLSAADADGDGDITTGDVVILQQFLAEWDDIVLGPIV